MPSYHSASLARRAARNERMPQTMNVTPTKIRIMWDEIARLDISEKSAKTLAPPSTINSAKTIDACIK